MYLFLIVQVSAAYRSTLNMHVPNIYSLVYILIILLFQIVLKPACRWVGGWLDHTMDVWKNGKWVGII